MSRAPAQQYYDAAPSSPHSLTYASEAQDEVGFGPASTSRPSSGGQQAYDEMNGNSGNVAGARGRGPPARSTTYDDRIYVGPGLPSAQTRGYARYAEGGQAGQQQWAQQSQLNHLNNNHGPTATRNPTGLYNQQNHSSPSLASGAPPTANFSHSGLPPSVLPNPSMDDINLSLESMSFQQRTPLNTSTGGKTPLERRYSPNSSGLNASNGSDGAMEIRSGRGPTASVYSLESVYSNTSAAPAAVSAVHEHSAQPGHFWQSSNNSQRFQTFPNQPNSANLERRRESGHSQHTLGTGGYDAEESHLPYDDGGYRGEAGPQYSEQSAYPSNSSAYPAADYYHQQAAAGPSRGAPHQMYQDQAQVGYGQPPAFQPQPQHGAYAYDPHLQQQNPYYAAATAQMGYPEQRGGLQPQPNLQRAGSNMSSMSIQPAGNQLARSQSSLNLPQMPPPNIRRKPTNSSQTSVQTNGPPITKSSVDEYRNRIKADPDPEAQFNFCKYLIEAAKKINSSSSGDEKSAKKYRDALLAESLKLIKRLATQGTGLGKPAYADAQFFLANCLGNGSLGLQVDHEKAYNLYVQASKQNHSSATYRTAVCNEVGAGTRRDHARAVLFYRKASALGDTAGMYKLGMILLNGLLGQQRNPKEAVAWLRRAASQADEDNPHALHELGLLYEKPQGSVLGYDPAQARELFTQAAQFGYAPSQFKLGSSYEYGNLTCPVDPRRSIAWYTRAAERGDAESELALSGWYLTGSEGVLKQSDSEAYLWARRAANKGLPKAEYAVGYYSEVGIGVKQDLEEAKRWYMRAAAQGNKRAMQRLTELTKLGAEKGKGGKTSRPTRSEAEKECTIM